MVEPVGSPPPQPSSSTPNVPQLSQQMYTQVEELATLMQGLVQDKSNSSNPTQLQAFAQVITQISQLVQETQKLR